MDRKDFFTKGFKDIAKELYHTPVGNYIDLKLQSIANALEPFAFYNKTSKEKNKEDNTVKKVLFVRPPGSNPDPKKFLMLCTSCGDCIISCPHHAIFRVSGIEGPVMNTNEKACYLCEDFPCIESCETNALSPLEENTVPYFGYAKVNETKCLNYDLIQTKKRKLKCTICYDECPIEDAIHLDNKIPTIMDDCIGCGICMQKCPENAIEIILE